MTEIGAPGWRPEKVHPLAELFPVLPPDDLDALAEHIKANGLQVPIAIADDGTLIDGRMRLLACDKAGREPTYQFINGQDPEEYIWGANGKRRQMTKGQMAMIAATAFTTAAVEKRGRGRPDAGKAKAAKAAGVSPQRFGTALAVKDDAPHLVEDVIAGKVQLDTAYTQAQLNRKEREWRENGLKMLRKQSPDLAQRVDDGELTLEEARKVLFDQEKAEETSRDAIFLSIASTTKAAIGLAESETVRRLPEWLRSEAGAEHHARYFKAGGKEAISKIDDAITALRGLRDLYAGVK